MIKVVVYILIIICGLAVGSLSFYAISIHAHGNFSMDMVCDAGVDLITDSTSKEKVDRFVSVCDLAIKHFGVIFSYSAYLTLFGAGLMTLGFVGLIELIINRKKKEKSKSYVE